MRVFITGGTGFIGSRVVHNLRKRGHTVRILRARLGKVQAVEQELKKFKPDCVVHLAWEGIPDVGRAMSAKNRTYGRTLFRLMGKYHIPKLIAVGSVWEYESPRELKDHHHDAFVATKRALRAEGARVMKKHQGAFIWAVPFFVYGTGKKAVSLIPSLVMQARRGETPSPKNPDVWHDFVHVDDVSRAISLLAEKNVPSGHYDIGSGILTRTGDIAGAIARIYKLPRPKLRKAVKKGVKANTRALQKATGWRPKITISAGIRAMLQ